LQQLSAERFLVNNLHDVLLKERDQGCKVDADDLKAVLSKSVSHQDNEENNLEAVLTWLENDISVRLKEAENILELIHWKRIPSNTLLQILVHNQFLQSNRNIKQLVLEKIRKVLCWSPVEKCSEDLSTAVKDEIYDRCEKGIILIGGLSLGEAEHGDISQPNCVCYIQRKGNWVTKSNWPERGLRGFSVSKYNSDVIVTGGSSTTASKHFVINRCWHYDVKEDSWRRIPDMNKCRSFHCSCQLNNRVFVIGGSQASSSKSSIDVEYYDQHKNSWTEIKQHAPKKMFNYTASACNGKLIIIGSTQTRNIFVQIYNPSSDLWQVLRSPNVPRHLSAPTSTTSSDQTQIFVSGDNTKKVYVFNPNTNTWCRTSDMCKLHSNGNMVSLDGNADSFKLVHTGGHWKNDAYYDTIEVYNRTKNVWKELGQLPFLWLYHQCAPVYLST